MPFSPFKNLSPKALRYLKLVSFILAIILATGTLTLTILVYRDVLESQDQLIKLLKQQVALTKNYADRFHQSELARKEAEQELKSTQDLYAQTQTTLEEVRAEFEKTKSMLAQAQAANVKLQDDAGQVQDMKEKVAGEFEQLKIENDGLKSDIEKLQDQIRYLSATDIKNKDEAKSLLKLYKTNISLVKVKIKEFKNRAQKTQTTMGTEQDRLKAIAGNHGYLIKDGSVVKVDWSAETSPKSKSHRKVDVTFVN